MKGSVVVVEKLTDGIYWDIFVAGYAVLFVRRILFNGLEGDELSGSDYVRAGCIHSWAEYADGDRICRGTFV